MGTMKLPKTAVTDIDAFRHQIVGLDPKDARVVYAKCGIRIAWLHGNGHPQPVRCPNE